MNELKIIIIKNARLQCVNIINTSHYYTFRSYVVHHIQLYIHVLHIHPYITFSRCVVRPSISPPSTADEIEVIIDATNYHLVVRRQRPWIERWDQFLPQKNVPQNVVNVIERALFSDKDKIVNYLSRKG